MKKIVLMAIIATGLTMSISAEGLAACTGCHGFDFEKKALGTSKIVRDMNKTEIVTALNGYKDGTYGRAMKGIMKGQVASIQDIEAIAQEIVNKRGSQPEPEELTNPDAVGEHTELGAPEMPGNKDLPKKGDG